MSDSLKKVFKKFFWVLLTFLLLEFLLIASLTVITTFLDVKMDLNIDIIFENLIQTAKNLPTVINAYISERNPFFLLGSGAIFIYSIYLQFANSQKRKSWEAEDELGYHGTARWGTFKEIFDRKNYLPKTKKEIQKDFYKSIK